RRQRQGKQDVGRVVIKHLLHKSKNMTIGFIGTGKISSAVVEAICTAGNSHLEIVLSPRGEMNSHRLAERFEQVTRAESNQEVANRSEIVFIALKTDIYRDVLRNISFRKEQTIVSFIPFSTISVLSELVAPAHIIGRATPLPSVVNHVCPIQVFNISPEVRTILGNIGQILDVETEDQLHTLWTLTCLISPFYDLMHSISNWTTENGVERSITDRYVADLFHSLTLAAVKEEAPDFRVLSKHAATPGGLNEWAAQSISESGAHSEYARAATHILKLFGNK
ncbi:MAG: NAD(P)-binding domain-containing protein, partial [Bacteroidales bacterium]